MLSQFQYDLENLLSNPAGLRPFVCEGSPLECRIFIVGFNPATELSRSFWEFWQPDYGFRKSDWFEIYKQKRREKPLSPGKTRRREISNTRRVIEWIVDAARPVKCLETNIYSRPSEDAVSLRERDRVTKPFDFLLNRIQPKAILVHGNDATAYMEALMKTSLPLWDLQSVVATWGSVHILAVPHLSRGWSEAKAREVGTELRHVCTK